MSLKKITNADVAPELQRYILRLPNWLITNSFARNAVGKIRFLIIGKEKNDHITIQEQTIENGLSLRIYTPTTKSSGAALLWIHGGGMVTGDPKDNDNLVGATAQELGILIVAPRYRHAPEHPFPAHLDDCLATWQWMLHSSDVLKIEVQRIAVGGQSAGGGLAASLVQKIHDMGGIQPRAQWLYCPMLDDRTAAKHELDGLAHIIWNNQLNRFGWSAYLGMAAGSDNVPQYAVPARREQLAGLPPAWIGIGDIDLFYEEDKEYAQRLQAAGVEVTFDEVPKAFHGFEILGWKTPIAQAFLRKSRAWLKATLEIV
jgi:acetyl esterase/lipase